MLEYIKKELYGYGIADSAAVPLSKCRLLRPYKLEKCGLDTSRDLTAIIFTIPYYTEHKEKNISSYAIARDYHMFCKELFDSLLPKLREKYPQNTFSGFSDDSPIDERYAAAISGLGVIGKNGMLITEKYSSYVFLAEIITDLPIRAREIYDIKYCEDCGKCRSACPKKEIGECLSALTQKKGELSKDEISALAKYKSAWGCDICSEVCPHTIRAIEKKTIYTDIPFFMTELIPTLDTSLIIGMTDSEFSSRAYCWRKKETILRNLNILENRK